MGNQKQKWTSEEEDALLSGVAKHGPGKWKNILKDPEFAAFLTHRSNIDLKDKWRNLSVSTSALGSKEKIRAPKVKLLAAPPVVGTQNSTPAAPLQHNASSDDVVDDTPQSGQDVKKENAPRYNAMIFEALTTIKDTNGSDANAIFSFIEQRNEVPPNFRRLLSSRLRRLVGQGKLEKVQNCYKIKKDTLLGTRTPAPKQKDVRPRQSPTSGLLTSNVTVKDAANTAACRVADAEYKSYLAADAVRDAERTSKLSEDTHSMLQLLNKIWERCSRGEVVLLA
ncbi:Telomere repeat-binding factor like [Quillaja saponaria]|uniref:MYB transcription factor n=1 Tax=Quillaja saponaria TaxID=32244 RepID=A0AAD7P9E5_QUISA|nr:Telomere repeat-binding factor like [Quillaja saponaria]